MLWKIVRPFIVLIALCMFPIAILSIPILVLGRSIMCINDWISEQINDELG